MWALSRRVTRAWSCCTMRGCTTRARAQLLQPERVRRLPPRVLVRPPGRAARLRRIRGRGPRRTDLLLLADAARRDARRRGWSPSTTRASPPICATSFPARAIEAIHLGHRGVRASPDPAARARVRAALGVPDDACCSRAFGKITAEKRIGAILRAFDGARRASRPTSICCWPATRRTIRRWREDGGVAAYRARASTSSATSRTRRSAITCGARTRACACAGRRRSKRRRRGCSAWRRRGRP